MASFFITGTDTGVGKTMVSGALARRLSLSGRRVGVLKPVETGCAAPHGSLVPADAVYLKEMAACPEEIEKICPYRFSEPLAPWVAATRVQAAIDPEIIIAAFQDMAGRYDDVLVEGAGGLMVPLTGKVFMADLVRALNIPLIIVARLGLGTINHTLLSVRQAIRCGIRVAGVVLNQLDPEIGIAEETNPQVVAALSGVPLIGRLPFVPPQQRRDAAFLADLVGRYLDLSVFSL
ncbi:MAG: dethiobiotin synthase [Deltaproteobacteria bacterium]|nr:dethiobiotin synthase [Deltaproteobacteria bacterium]